MHSWFTSPSSSTLPIISGTCREQRAAATWHISTRTSPSRELFYYWHSKVRDAIRLMDKRHARKDLAPGVTLTGFLHGGLKDLKYEQDAGTPGAAWRYPRLQVSMPTRGECMSAIASDTRTVSAGEPNPIIPPLALFYLHARDLGWLVVRLTAGGMLLVHGIIKVMPMTERGFAAVIEAFAVGSLARRGIEPALYFAYAVFFIETIGAVLIILGLFTRFIAAAAAIEFAVITFIAHWPAGFAASRGGWEYPLFWGLILFAIALRGGGPYSLDRKLGWEL